MYSPSCHIDCVTLNHKTAPIGNYSLMRSASTICTLDKSQPRPPPRFRKRGQSLTLNNNLSSNSSQCSLVTSVYNYAYSDLGSKPMFTNNFNLSPNSSLRRHLSSDAMSNSSQTKRNGFQKVLPLNNLQTQNIPEPPQRISSVKNILRRSSYVENMDSNEYSYMPPPKPVRKKLLRVSEQMLNLSKNPRSGIPPSGFFSSNHLYPSGLPKYSCPIRSQSASSAAMTQYQPKTMSLDNLNNAILSIPLRKSPTREELFDYIIAQQEQLSELKTQQKVLEKQVDLAQKEASKAHHHHHHRHHHRSQRRNKDNIEDSSSMISSDRRSRSSRSQKSKHSELANLATKQVHEHIKQLQKQLELIRQKRHRIKNGENVEISSLDEVQKQKIKADTLSSLSISRSGSPFPQNNSANLLPIKNDDIYSMISGTTTGPRSPSNERSPLCSRSSSVDRATIKKELLKESVKEKWNKSFADDFYDEDIDKKSFSNTFDINLDLPKIAVSPDSQHNSIEKEPSIDGSIKQSSKLDYNEILEKNLRLNSNNNWFNEKLDDLPFTEKNSQDATSPFGGRTGTFKPAFDREKSIPQQSSIEYDDELLIIRNNKNEQKKLLNEENQIINKLEEDLEKEKIIKEELLMQQKDLEQSKKRHEIELETVHLNFLEQQKQFQDQQRALIDQKQQIELARCRMEQEAKQAQQALQQQELNMKQEQINQQQMINQKLQQQQQNFEKQLQNQLNIQKQMQKKQEQQFQSALQKQQIQMKMDLEKQLQENLTKNKFHQQHLQQQHKQMELQEQLKIQKLNQLQQRNINSISKPSMENKWNEYPSPKPKRNHRLGHDSLSPKNFFSFNLFKPLINNNSKNTLSNSNLHLSPASSYKNLNLHLLNSSQNNLNESNKNNILSSNFNSSKKTKHNLPILSLNNSRQNLNSNSEMLSPHHLSPPSNSIISNDRLNFMNSPNQITYSHSVQNVLQGSFNNLTHLDRDFKSDNMGRKNLSSDSIFTMQPINQGQHFDMNKHSMKMRSNQNSVINNNRFDLRQGNSFEKLNFVSNLNQQNAPVKPPRNMSPSLMHPVRTGSMSAIDCLVDPFRDHFDQYFVQKNQALTKSKEQSDSTKKLVGSVGELNKEINILKPNASKERINLDFSANKSENASENKLEINLTNRRLTLPDLSRSFDEQIKFDGMDAYCEKKSKTINDGLSRNEQTANLGRKKSLPESIGKKDSVPSGWEREEVSHLAHKVREAKAKAAERNVTKMRAIRIKDWIAAHCFLICLIIFNMSIIYIYVQILQPLYEQ